MTGVVDHGNLEPVVDNRQLQFGGAAQHLITFGRRCQRLVGVEARIRGDILPELPDPLLPPTVAAGPLMFAHFALDTAKRQDRFDHWHVTILADRNRAGFRPCCAAQTGVIKPGHAAVGKVAGGPFAVGALNWEEAISWIGGGVGGIEPKLAAGGVEAEQGVVNVVAGCA